MFVTNQVWTVFWFLQLLIILKHFATLFMQSQYSQYSFFFRYVSCVVAAFSQFFVAYFTIETCISHCVAAKVFAVFTIFALHQVIADAPINGFFQWVGVTEGHFFASLWVVVLLTSPDAVTVPAAFKQGFSGKMPKIFLGKSGEKIQ